MNIPARAQIALALLFGLLAVYLRDPLLLPLRPWLGAGVFLAAVLGLSTAVWHWPKRCRHTPLRAAMWLALAAGALFQISAEYRARQAVMAAYARVPATLALVGTHLVVGYDSPAAVKELASRGLIGGVFVSQHNAAGKSVVALRDELASLQSARRRAGLPPLLIAADQEGGPVSRLSPPLAAAPPLSSLLATMSEQALAQRVAHYATAQARGLAALGINTNFSPVIDLKMRRTPRPFDWHTRIEERAISSDPRLVARVADAYGQALLAQGVVPTLKHFPGLGRVDADTHLSDAHLQASIGALNASDWLPFQQVLRHTPAMLMVGHVTVDALDASRPASVSPAVLTGLIRAQWRFQGVMISDDLSMAPTYRRGLCRSSVESLNGGMDLLLLSYDHQKIYAVLDCLQHALRTGQLDRAQLERSVQRLRALPWRRTTI